MANVIINESHLNNIAEAIRSKKGTYGKMYPKDMATEIESISSGSTDTSDATATAEDILRYKTAYVNDRKITGNMINIGKRDILISSMGAIMIPKGYHDGTGIAQIDPSEKSKLIPENIKNGISILGVTGTLQAGTSGGDQVRTGTTSSPTINTGLSSIERFILYSDKIVSTGLMNLAYYNDSSTITFCGEYNAFLQTCKTIQHNSHSISGGTFTWTDNAVQYKFMTGATYTWIAIGR